MNEMIQFKNISKVFPGVKALDDVSFSIKRGEIHALLGENGAGKSTLLKILHGVYCEYSGETIIDNKKVSFRNENEAIQYGVSIVHQEINVIPELTVGQNIALGYEPKKGLLIDYKKMYEHTDEILKRLNCKFKSTDIVSSLSVGEMQMISIAKALFNKAQIISFDEPTSSLTSKETETLFSIINELKGNGITIIYVSHRLEEIFQIADRATILRDGKYIYTYDIASITKEKLIQSMVGRDVSSFAVRYKPSCVKDEVVLETKHLNSNIFEDISFNIRKGELLGFAGLVGAKRTDVMRTIFGADKKTGGEVYINGKKADIKSPEDALKYGIGLIPEDRKRQGFVKQMSNADNIGLASMKKFTSKLGFVNHNDKTKNALNFIEKLKINPKIALYPTNNLSGGNQQKVILAKWLSTQVDILIFDEPTKGVDVGAKAEIYKLMEDLLQQGKSIIMVSSELPEIIGMSDRVIVMREGKQVKELKRDEFSEEKILHYAMGGQ